MKLHILPLLAAGLLAASAAVSCSDDPSWTDSSATQTDKYSFLHSTRSFNFFTARPLDQYTVTLLRGTSKGAATVAVRVKADTLQASYLPDTLVHFADGSTTAELVVKVNHRLLTSEKTAVDTLELAPDKVSATGTRRPLALPQRTTPPRAQRHEGEWCVNFYPLGRLSPSLHRTTTFVPNEKRKAVS